MGLIWSVGAARVCVAVLCVGTGLGVVRAQDGYGDAPAYDSEQSLDYLVRGDYFKGLLRDDAEAWARAAATVERRLAEKPGDGEALAWKGAMWVSDAGDAFDAGDAGRGMELYAEGLRMMDEGVATDDTVNSWIPRGVTLMQVYGYEPDPARSRAMLETALGDLERSMAWLTPRWATQSEHAKGMLMLMLADARAARAEMDIAAAATLRSRIVDELAGTRYATQAEAALEIARVPKEKEDDAAGADAGVATGPIGREAVLFAWLAEVVRTQGDEGRVPAGLMDHVMAGLGGDAAALARAEGVIDGMRGAGDPGAKALVAFFDVMHAGTLFEAGDFGRAFPMWQRGLAGLDAAAGADAEAADVRACRAVTYLMVHMHERDAARAAEMVRLAGEDASMVGGAVDGVELRAGAAVAAALAADARGDATAAEAHAREAVALAPRSVAGRYAAGMLN